MSRSLPLLLLVLLSVSLTGCLGRLGPRPLSYRHYGEPTQGWPVVHADYYEDCCGDHDQPWPAAGPAFFPGRLAHIPALHHVGACATTCGPTDCHACDGGRTVAPWGAYRGLPILQRLQQRFACGDGCGEVYVGEWISTPPTPDPCDLDGNPDCLPNDMMYRPQAQPLRNTLRKIAGIRHYPGYPVAPYGWEADSIGQAEWDSVDESQAMVAGPPVMTAHRPPTRQANCDCHH